GADAAPPPAFQAVASLSSPASLRPDAGTGFGTIASWGPDDGAEPCRGYVQPDAQLPDAPLSDTMPLPASEDGPGVVLVAAALPAPGTSRAPPVNPLQRLKQPGSFRINGPITYSSDQVTAERTGRVRLSGNADVHMDDRRIQADQMVYDRNTNDISVSGRVRYGDPTLNVQGDTGHYGNEGAQFTHAQFQFLARPGRGTATDLSMTPNHVITLRGVTYTSCPPPHADWDIHARELRLDTNISRGVARGARVDFQGIPVLYLPYLSFPLSSARQSGVLFPNVGSSSRDGLILGVPWYWNIAPNQDATFTPTYYSDRGLDLGAEYRFLSTDDSGTFDGDFMPHDSRYGDERNYARLLDRLELGDNTRLQTDLESVSDTEYFEDFSQGTQTTSTPFLPRSLKLMHRDDIWNLQLQALGYETLDDNTLPQIARPYLELPRLSAASDWSPPGWPLLRMGFDSELVDFTRADCGGPAGQSVCTCPPRDVTDGCLNDPGVLLDFPRGINVNGWRLDAQPHIGLDLSAPGYFVRPNVTWELTQYALSGVGDDDPDPTRSLPIMTFDSGLKFERLAGLDGVRTVTLEPRVMYVYIPYRDQSELPLFDSSTQDPNLIELFQPNRYVGIDRIGDANEVTVGLTSETFSTASGSRYLSATIGQSLYLSPPRVTMPGETLDANHSDLIAEVDLTAYRNWNVLLNAATSDEVSRIEQTEAQLQYRASGQQVANIGYQYRDGQFQQIDSSVAWPILQHWDLYARAVYSLLDHASIEDFAGFQYRGACWGLRAVWQRSVTTRTGERDTGVSVQLELTGLSNVGSQVDTFLQQSIRGYSAVTGRAAAGRMTATPPPTP
ncbi:MAG TPA: LPS assembly protein LptD, partial [Steroidobacteraceae bacterium]|nr:LPS assembly protein LptD [Steroidobacteraceae bacterium]